MSVVLSVGSTVRPTRAAPAARRCHAILPLIPTRSRAAASAPVHERRLRGTSETFQRCTVAKAAAEDEPVKRNLLFLGLLFTGWYAFTIYFNIFNKQLLKIWLYPLTATCIQFAVGGAIGLFWFAATRRPIIIRKDILQAVLPLAMVHTLANALTNVSLGLMAVSFAHTVKAMEPFFSVLLSMAFLHERPHPIVLLTLLPIVVGVIGASVNELSFTWIGFAAAMGSNISLCFRNVLSKRFMTPDIKELLGGAIGLFSMITLMSFVMLVPIAVAVEGFQLTPAAFQAAGVEPEKILKLVASSALCFHLYQQVSYMILARVTPVSHSIGNCLKRVVVIVAAVLFFKNPVTTQSMIFTGVALFGVFAYSQAKRIYGSIKMDKGKKNLTIPTESTAVYPAGSESM